MDNMLIKSGSECKKITPGIHTAHSCGHWCGFLLIGVDSCPFLLIPVGISGGMKSTRRMLHSLMMKDLKS